MKVLFRAALLAVMLVAIGATAVSAAPTTPATVTPATAVPTLARVNYLSFLNHMNNYFANESDAYDWWSIGNDYDDYDTMAEGALQMRNYARSEHKWLIAHTPTSSCFKAIYASQVLETHYVDIGESYAYQFYANYDLAAGKKAPYWIGKATAELKRGTALLKKTHC